MHSIITQKRIVFLSVLFSILCGPASFAQRSIQRDSIVAAFENTMNPIGIRAQEELSALSQKLRGDLPQREKLKLRDSIDLLIAQYKKRGIQAYQFESIWYWKIRPMHIIQTYGNLFSDLEKEVAKLRQMDCDIPLLTLDGELLDPRRIPPRILICDRILMMGAGRLKTVNMRPDEINIIRSQTEDERNKYLFLLYFGTQKNPSTDPKTTIIKGEFWNPMYEFTRTYPRTASTRDMLLFIKMLEANNYRMSPDIKEDLMRLKSAMQ